MSVAGYILATLFIAGGMLFIGLGQAEAVVTTGGTTGNTSEGQQGGSEATGSYGGSVVGSSFNIEAYKKNLTGKSTSEVAQLTDLMKRVQDLLAQVRELRLQISGGSTPGTSPRPTTPPRHTPGLCSAIPNLGNFGQGMSGTGVKNIQQFLVNEGYLTSDNATGYFGNTTAQAVKKWQIDRKIVSATSTATTTGAGRFGRLTREDMIRRCENHDGDAMSAFKLSPSIGKAPLRVEVANVPAAVLKKMNECKKSVGRLGTSGNGLTVDWGDGTKAPAAATSTNAVRSCADEVKKHTYTTPGVYTVKIRSWSPGPTDAPITSWEGTSRVTVTEGTRATSTATTTVSVRTEAALKARKALARELDAFTSTLTITKVVKTDWTDGCLGLGGAAESCLAAITPGFRVTMTKASSTYYARTNATGSVVRFEGDY